MARRGRTGAGKRRKHEEIAQRLIGGGLLLGLIPLFLGTSPIGAAFRPLVPLGWLLFVVGCGLIWWRARASRLTSAEPRLAARTPAEASRRTSDAAGPVDRTASELDRLSQAAADRGRRPESPPRSWGPAVFDVIEWRRFEALVEALFAQAGFETKAQSHGADGGIDIWLYSRNNPGKAVSIVQCKHWQGRRVGVDKVRELRGAMAAAGVPRGQFAATSTFTDDAIAFAKDNAINLLDVEAMLALIAMRTPEQQRSLLAVAMDGDYWRPTCVNCGAKMVERTPRNGGSTFWGCANYPKCKTKMTMRRASA